jgi:hypothetical protein
MKANQIELGKIYVIKHFGQMCRVRVDGIVPATKYSKSHYTCLKLDTGRQITVKSAAKFRRLAGPVVPTVAVSNATHKLVDIESGHEVKIGDQVVDFRGSKAIVTGFQAGHTAESTGRIFVKESGITTNLSFYPSVFGLKIVALSPQEQFNLSESDPLGFDRAAYGAVCPKCGESFATHNDDGSCVDDDSQDDTNADFHPGMRLKVIP